MTTVEELLTRLLHAPRVLVVEDLAAPVEVMLRRNYDCFVDTTSDGLQAVRLLASEKYDLVLLDLGLLNGTGEFVLKTAQDKCPDTPVVATADNQTNIESLMAQVGSLTLINSPVTLSTVERLFRVFKIKARTRALAEFCQHRVSAAPAA